MESLKVLRYRIRSVGKIQQITKTMQMVSVSRLRRAAEALRRHRPYLGSLEAAVGHLQEAVSPEAHPFFLRPGGSARESRDILVLIASDRGLCGTYNAQIFMRAEAELRRRAGLALICAGRKTGDYFRRRQAPVLLAVSGLTSVTLHARASEVAREVTGRFLTGEVGTVDLLYTRYPKPFTYYPTIERLLPLSTEARPSSASGGGPGGGGGAGALFEPGLEELLAWLLPAYLEARLAGALAEAFTAEQAARLMAMKLATDNATEMIEELTLTRNKARQAAITKDMTEITTSAEAMKAA